MPSLVKSRKSGRSARGSRKAITKVLSNSLHGASLRARADPPAIVDRPWNTVTLTLPLAAAGNITVALINAAFNTQVGAGTATPALLYRFKEVRAWELSGADIALGLYDFDRATLGEVIRTQQDQPGRNHWARVASMWSVTQQNDVVPSMDTTRDIFFLASSAATVNIRVHLNLLWRFAGASQPQLREAQLGEFRSLNGFSNGEKSDSSSKISEEPSEEIAVISEELSEGTQTVPEEPPCVYSGVDTSQEPF